MLLSLQVRIGGFAIVGTISVTRCVHAADAVSAVDHHLTCTFSAESDESSLRAYESEEEVFDEELPCSTVHFNC